MFHRDGAVPCQAERLLHLAKTPLRVSATGVDSPPHASDRIRIEELEVFARVGVTDNERANPQRLTLSITVWPTEAFENLNDDITRATNYSGICAVVRDLAAERSDRLIETLASEMAAKGTKHGDVSGMARETPPAKSKQR